ncbi:MATE family efflux transporter [Allobaculum fili]|uniref:MATE family efflux transporter n=1 Tax=Allobaculum fili TaxID=2834460 RepID=UPI001E4F6F30|nr:MATE family efflux transporter [Allobaculum fili]
MRKDFFRTVLKIAVPAALQSMAVSCFSIADQIMIGQSGETVIAGVGFGAKFVSLALAILSGAAAGAGILCAQYEGQNNRQAMIESFSQIFLFSMAISALFILLSLTASVPVMGLYSPDPDAVAAASRYLTIYVWTLPFSSVTTLYAVLLRCCGYPSHPLHASLAGIVANTALNALFIFGLGGQEVGAAWASLFSQALMAGLAWKMVRKHLPWVHLHFSKSHLGMIIRILLPLLICEGLWSLGENVYAMVYGHTSTVQSAAMTMTIPLQSLLMGILGGFSQAAGILIGQRLGKGQYENAWNDSLSLIRYSFFASLLFATLLVLLSPLYVSLFSVDGNVRQMTLQLIAAFALMSIVKVQNMVIAGGILRSGGQTSIVMAIDLIGTWGFGVPLAFFALHQGFSILWIYLILSSEEVVRLLISLAVLVSRKWMKTLPAQG